jgi:hypothetical protein
MANTSFQFDLSAITNLFKNKSEEDKGAAEQTAANAAFNPMQQYKVGPSTTPMFDSGTAADAVTAMQNAMSMGGINNTAANMLRPGASFVGEPIMPLERVDPKYLDQPVAQPSPVEAEMSRAEGEWNQANGVLADQEEEQRRRQGAQPVLMQTGVN